MLFLLFAESFLRAVLSFYFVGPIGLSFTHSTFIGPCFISFPGQLSVKSFRLLLNLGWS